MSDLVPTRPRLLNVSIESPRTLIEQKLPAVYQALLSKGISALGIAVNE